MLVELETDKATVEIVAEASGVLTIKKKTGATVTIGEVIAVISETTDPATETEKNSATKKSTGQESAEKHSDIRGHTKQEPAEKLSPAVRRIVAEKKIDATKIKGSGKDGRLLKADVATSPLLEERQASAPAQPVTSTSSEQEEPQSPVPAQPVASTNLKQERRVPMSMIRRRIAERLVAAKK